MDQQPPFDSSNFDQFRFQNFAQFPQFITGQLQHQHQHQHQHPQSVDQQNQQEPQPHLLTGHRNDNDNGLGALPTEGDHGSLSRISQIVAQTVPPGSGASNAPKDNASAADIAVDPSKLPRATLQQKIDVLDWYHANEKKSQQQTVNHFQKFKKFAITKSSFNRWLKEEPKLRKDLKNISFTYRNVYKTKPNLRNPEINRALELFYEQNMYERNVDQVSERLLLKRFEKYALMFDPNFDVSKAKRSNGWLHHFKRKNSGKKNMIQKFFVDNERIFNTKNLNAEKVRLKNTLKSFQLRDIYHFDEFKVTSNVPGRKLFDESELKVSELLVGLCVNADGSEFIDPLIVGKEGHQKDVKLKNFSNYFQHPAAGITTEIFHEYVVEWDRRIGRTNPNRRIALLVDTLYAHIIPLEELKHIELIYFSPNFISYLSYPIELFNKNIASLTEFFADPTGKSNYSFKTKNVVLLNSNAKRLGKLEIQPINLGVSRIFKSYYKLHLFEYYLSQLLCLENDKDDGSLGDFTPDSLAKIINDITESDLIYFVTESWESLKTENESYEKNAMKADVVEQNVTSEISQTVPVRKNIISNCFKNSDILPFFNVLSLTSDVNSNPINPIVFSDHSKEYKLLKILKLFEIKKLIALEKRKPYLSLTRVTPSDYLPLKIEDILFPNEEFVLNKHLSDEEIISIVKEEMVNFEKSQEELKRDTEAHEKRREALRIKKANKPNSTIVSSSMTNAPSSISALDLSNVLIDDQLRTINNNKEKSSSPNPLGQQVIDEPQDENAQETQVLDENSNYDIDIHELLDISKFLNRKVKSFLNEHSKGLFPKSNYYFKNFLISFILESNDMLLDSTEFGELSDVEQNFNNYFSSLGKRYGRGKSRASVNDDAGNLHSSVNASVINMDSYANHSGTSTSLASNAASSVSALIAGLAASAPKRTSSDAALQNPASKRAERLSKISSLIDGTEVQGAVDGNDNDDSGPSTQS